MVKQWCVVIPFVDKENAESCLNDINNDYKLIGKVLIIDYPEDSKKERIKKQKKLIGV